MFAESKIVRRSSWIDGQPADADAFMPLVLINPVVRLDGAPTKGPEGCLSFPEIYAEIERAAEVEVTALNERGESFSFRAGGCSRAPPSTRWII